MRPDHCVENDAAVGDDDYLRLGYGLILDGNGPGEDMLKGSTVKTRKADSDTIGLRSRLRKRTDGAGDDITDITDEEFKQLQKLDKKLRDTYRTLTGKEKKRRIDQSLANPESPTATDEELAEHERLTDASERYRSINKVRTARKRKEKTIAKAREIVDQYTPEELETIRQQWSEYRQRFRSKRGKNWVAELPREERQKYDRLVEPYKEYERYRSQQRKLEKQTDGSPLTCQEREILDHLYPAYMEYYQRFKAKPKELARMRRGDATEAELAEWESLKKSFNAYNRQINKPNRRPQEVDIKYPESMSEEVKQLEDLRELRNTYVQFFGGSKNAEKRRQLADGIGTEGELELWQELRQPYLEYNRLYTRLRKCASTSPGPEVTTKGIGRRPRWFQRRPGGTRRGAWQRPSSPQNLPGGAANDDASSGPPPTDRTEIAVTEAPWTTTPGIVQQLQRFSGAVSGALRRYVGPDLFAPRPVSPPAPATRPVLRLGVGR